MTEKEENAIEYLKVRLYGNECCKFIDVSQEDLRIFLKLINKKEKEIESLKKYSNEQEESIIEKNNKICDLEFKIENQQKSLEQKDKEISELKDKYVYLINKIENKIDKFDYEFEKAKRKNDNDRADYYWDLIINFKKLLENEE